MAGTFARAVQFCHAFLLVPVLLSTWGAALYGEWVILTAVASVGSLPNFGVVQASASEIMLAVAAKDERRASTVLTTSTIAAMAICAAILVTSWVLIHTIDPKVYMAISIISSRSAENTLFLALASIILTAFIPPLSGALSAVIGNGPSITVGAAIKIVELVAITVVVYAGGGPVAVAAILVISVTISTLVYTIFVRIFVPSLSFRPRYFDFATLRRLVPSSLAQLLLYVSINHLSVQLPRIVLGELLGSTAVAAFAVASTYMRTVRTLSSIFSQALFVEAVRAFAESRFEVLTRMVRGLCQVNLWASIILMGALLLVGERFFAIWTHGRIAFDLRLSTFLGFGFVIGAYSDAILQVLIGLNRVMVVAVGHICAVAVALALATFLVSKWGIVGMVATIAIPDGMAVVLGMLTFTGLLSLSFPEFFVSTMQWPTDMIRREISQLTQVVFGMTRK